MNKKQLGFSAVEFLLLLIFIAIVCLIGVSVYHRQQTSKSNSTVTKPATTSAPIKSTLFTDTNGEYSFQLPDGWATEYSGLNKNSNSKPLWLSPKDLPFTKTGDGPNYVVSIDTTNFPGSYADGTTFANFAAFKQLNIQDAGSEKIVNQDMTINSDPVWKFGATIPDSSPTGPPEISGGNQVINYYYHKNPGAVVDVSMRVYEHTSVNFQGTKIQSAFDFTKYLPDLQLISSSFKLK